MGWPSKQPRTMRGVVLQALMALAVGFIMMISGWADAKFAMDLPRFVEGQATITSVDASYGRQRWWRWRHSLRIRYEFLVDGRCIGGNRYKLGAPRFDSTGEAIAYAKSLGFGWGSIVPVYYDPANPRRNILSREIDPWWIAANWGLIAMGTTLAWWGSERSLRLATSRAYRDKIRRGLEAAAAKA